MRVQPASLVLLDSVPGRQKTSRGSRPRGAALDWVPPLATCLCSGAQHPEVLSVTAGESRPVFEA